jgi:DNA-binding transcriptional LysR family regulator
LASLKTVSLRDLAGETWVLREPGSASRQVVEQALTTHGVAWQEHLHMSNNEAMKQAIMAGLGISMVSRLAVMLELRHGLLYEISVANLQVDRQISVVYRTDAALSAAARAFLDVLSHHDTGLSA